MRALALEADERLLARLRAQVDLQEALIGADDYSEFVAADPSFHRQMYEAAGVPDLWDLVRRGSGHVDRLRRLHLPSAGKAQAVVREHLSGTLSQIDEICQRYPDYVSR